MAMESLQKAYARDEVREMIRARENARFEDRSRMELATQQGLEQGREAGLEQQRLSILELLSSRFQELPPDLTSCLEEIKDPNVLLSLILKSATAPDLPAFLDEISPS